VEDPKADDPAGFSSELLASLTKVIASSNRSLLHKWKEAALQRRQVNVKYDLSSMVLEVTLRAIFGNDYDQVAEHFNVLSQESACDLKFAQAFRALKKIVFLLAAERRKRIPEGNDLLSKLMEARSKCNYTSRPSRKISA
jgi:cytochrome P450